MKQDKSKNTDAQLKTLPKFPFEHMLPVIPSGGLTTNQLRILSERLRNAVAAKSKNLKLTDVEANSFQENCVVIRKVKLGLELRNYSLLEIYAAKQWRADYQSVEQFAKMEADLSKGHLMKCIDSAAIALAMVEAGLEVVAPTGRQVEELAKVQCDHWAPAWRYALEVFVTDGRSASVAQYALREYCRDKGIPFGRRKPNGSNDIGLLKFLSPSRKCAKKGVSLKKPNLTIDWLDRLSTSEEQIFASIVPNDVLDTAKAQSGGKSSGRMIGEILRQIGSDGCNDPMAENMEAALSLMIEKDPSVANKLFKFALCHFSEFVSRKIEQQICESHPSI